MRRLKKEKLLLILMLILFVVVMPLTFIALFWPKFKVKSFKDVIIIPYQQKFQIEHGTICYGNAFHCEDVEVEHTGNVDITQKGEYKITYIYKYKTKSYQKEQTIKVIDNTPPKLEVKETEFYYCKNSIPDYEVKAWDDYDGDITKNIEKKVENGKIIFSVTDSSNNKTIIEKEAIEKDIENPTIKLIGGEKIFLNLHEEYEEKGVTALDNCDGDISDKVKIEGNVDTKKEGEYTIKYTIQDEKGNETSKTRTIIVAGKKIKEEKNIYLTFDDGPSKYTKELLDILKKYDVKATFFVTNQTIAKPYEDLILRAYKEGHTIGLHSYTHTYDIYQNEETYFNDLYKIQEKVKNITGYTSNIIRFPGGSSNTISRNYDNNSHIMSKLTKSVEEKGFRYFDWNVISGDAGETTDTMEIVSHVILEIGKRKDSMILQHDIKDYSVKAVENIIEYGLRNGYNFLKITEETPNFHHRVNN